MSQRINLLVDLPKWEKAQYPFNFVIGLNIVLILLLMAFYVLYYWEYKTKDRIVSGILYQYNTATKQLNMLQQQVLATGKEEKADAEYQSFLYNVLEKNAKNGSQHVYNILDDLGEQINPGVWLNRIDLENFAKNVTLTGFTIQPQDAMSYVAALNNSPYFSSNKIQLDNIRNVSNKNYLYIQMTSQSNNKLNRNEGLS